MVASPDHSELPFVEAAGYTNGRPDGPPLWLIVHTMEAQEASTTAENTANYFADPGDGRQVSAHYCCDNNSIVQCVELSDSAWTVGNRPGNNRGINFEFAGFANQTPPQWGDAYSTAMLERAAPYFRSDAARYNIPLRRCSVSDLEAFRPGVTSHNDLRLAFGVTTHTDPGPNFPWEWFIDLLNGQVEEMADTWYLVQSADPEWHNRSFVSNRIHRRQVRTANPPLGDSTMGATKRILTDAMRDGVGYSDWDLYLDEVAGPEFPALECTCNCDGGALADHTHEGGETGPVVTPEPDNGP